MYQPDHPFYQTAEEFRDHLLLDYVDIIQNAETIILTDSSVFCLAIHLHIKSDDCFPIEEKLKLIQPNMVIIKYLIYGLININPIIPIIKNLNV